MKECVDTHEAVKLHNQNSLNLRPGDVVEDMDNDKLYLVSSFPGGKWYLIGLHSGIYWASDSLMGKTGDRCLRRVNVCYRRGDHHDCTD